MKRLLCLLLLLATSVFGSAPPSPNWWTRVGGIYLKAKVDSFCATDGTDTTWVTHGRILIGSQAIDSTAATIYTVDTLIGDSVALRALLTGAIFTGNLTLDDGVGDSPTMFYYDGSDKYFQIKKASEGQAWLLNNDGGISLRPSNDVNDYLLISTASNIVTIETVASGDGDLVIKAGGGDISFDDDNLSTSGKIVADTMRTAMLQGDTIKVGTAYVLPAVDGDATEVLKTNGSGVLSWESDDIGEEGTGDITEVTAGHALIGGGVSGAVTLHANASTSIDTSGDSLQVIPSWLDAVIDTSDAALADSASAMDTSYAPLTTRINEEIYDHIDTCTGLIDSLNIGDSTLSLDNLNPGTAVHLDGILYNSATEQWARADLDATYLVEQANVEWGEDAAAGIFTAGSHAGISYSYVDGSDLINTTVNAADADSIMGIPIQALAGNYAIHYGLVLSADSSEWEWVELQDGDITAVGRGYGLDGGGSTDSVHLTVDTTNEIASKTYVDNEIDSSAFQLDDLDYVTLDTANDGGIKIAEQSATSGQVLKWNGSIWTPAADDSTGGGGGGGTDSTDWYVQHMLTGNVESGVTVTYQASDSTIDYEVDVKVSDSTASNITAENLQDGVAAMLGMTGGDTTRQHDGALVTYDDASGELDIYNGSADSLDHTVYMDGTAMKGMASIEGTEDEVSIENDTLRLGDRADDDDVELAFISTSDSGGVRYDAGTNKMQFSNDYSSWTDIDGTDHGGLAGLADDDHTQYLLETEIDASSELLAIMDDETGTGVLVFGTAPTFTTSITIGSAVINETELEIIDGASLTTTELNYVDGVTSALQTQLDGKEQQLDNEAGLYAVLSDVSDFLQITDTANAVANGENKVVSGNAIYDYGVANYQPLEATLTDIADGTIAENLVNTGNPWAADEIVSTVIHNDEMDASSELLAIMDDETGSGSGTPLLVFNVAPDFTLVPTFDSAQFDGNVDVDSMDINGVLDVTGNITAGGTIDGVDLATFEATLDDDTEVATEAEVGDTLAALRDGDAWTGTHDFTGATVIDADSMATVHLVATGEMRADCDFYAEGNVHVNKDSTAADAAIYFGDDDEVTSFHWDDANDRFEVSNTVYVGGNVDLLGTVDGVDVAALNTDLAADSGSWNDVADDLNYTFNLADPDALYATDHEWSIDPRTRAALTITRIDVSLDADPTTELEYSLKFADALIGFANATVIDDTATVAGVTTVTGGFGDATVPANKCIYFLFDADPDDAITQVSVKISYTFD